MALFETASRLPDPLCAMNAAVHLWDGLVEKRAFSMPVYTTLGGATIRNLRVGWEAYGRLNERKDNVVLIGHYFSANSHAAGRYGPHDEAAGYWDGVIGPGKAIDTNRYYVISVDSLVNLNAKDGVTITTGPATPHPETGKPYAMDFPVVTIPDFVKVQKALLDSLGIRHLRMVGGPSMGALQGFEWAAAYPEMVERVLAVVGVPYHLPYGVLELGRWALPVRLDPRWKNGNYYGGPEPVDGVAMGLVNISVGARHAEYVEEVFGYKPAEADHSPLESVAHPFRSESAFLAASRARAASAVDANHLLYMTRANQLFVPGLGSSVDRELKKIRARVLLMPSRTDLLFPPQQVRPHYERLRANGTPVEYHELDTSGGHLGGIVETAKAAGTIRRFLDE